MRKVVIVEDHPVMRMAIEKLLATRSNPISTVGFSDFDGLKTYLEQEEEPDLVLLDLEIPGAHGFSALAHVQYCYPTVPVVILSGHEAPEIISRALELGAFSFLPKSLPLDQLGLALDQVLDGHPWQPDNQKATAANQEENDVASRMSTLTPQQVRITMGLAQGHGNKRIAYDLRITEGTVKNHVTVILQKLQLHSRTQVVQEISGLIQVSKQDLEQYLEPTSANSKAS